METIKYLQIDDATAIPMEEAVELKEIMLGALRDYKKSGLAPKEWSKTYFKAQFPEKDDAEITQWSEEIDETLTKIDEKRASIAKARQNGIGVDDWFARDVQAVTAQMSGQQAAEYMNNLDAAVRDMNRTWADAIQTNSGAINMNPNLDGFIAEAHHVNTFNADAAAKSSPYRAEMLKPGDKAYSKNSVDIVIKDGNGKVVRRYQSKYGKDAETTTEMFGHGDYRGQRKLAPEGQDVAGSTDHIEIDGVKSKPLSKEGAKRKQEEAHSGKVPTENYNAYDTKVMLKHIGRDVAIAGAIGAGMNVAFDIGAKLAQGEDVELEDVAVAAIKGGGDAAVKTAAASAVKVAIEKNVLKAAAPLKGTPLAPIIAAIDIGVSNVRTLFKMGSGEMTFKDGVYEMEANTCAGVGGYIGATKGMAIGAKFGAFLGPIGIAVGGFVGGVVGGIAGSTVYRAVAKGAQFIRDKICEGVKAIGKVGRRIFDGVRSFLFG